MENRKKREKNIRGVRFVLYIVGKLLACVAILYLGIFAFKTAENSSQIYICLLYTSSRRITSGFFFQWY